MENLKPGSTVRITQQFPRLSGTMVTTVEGVVTRVGQEKSGSWFAHTRDNKVWIDRVELRKKDGELVVLNLDRYSAVEVLQEAPAESTG
ncbi:MAG: hypothetical protein KIT54_00755 [Phycisphaeraceae bacterium]|nr:hypothetical protein [Phycisphaeraceae bacterium]